MKIIQFTAENVKKLKVVSIKPDGTYVEIAGPNGAGKTSVLDAIWWALAGKKNIQSVPIHAGSEEARIHLDLGAIRVERKFTDKGTTTLTVRNAKDAAPGTPDKKLPKWQAPQEMLDAMLGELTFDPLKFSRMERSAQFEELRRISKLSVDIDVLDAANEEDYKTRTDVNRNAKELRAQAEGIWLPENLPNDPIDEDRLLNKIQTAAAHNAEIETRKIRREQAELEISRAHERADRIRQEADAGKLTAEGRIQRLREQIQEIESLIVAEEEAAVGKIKAEQAIAKDLGRKLKDAPPLPDPVSVDELRSELDAARETNEHIRRRTARSEKLDAAAALEAESDALTKRMKGRDKQKRDAIAAADMPVDGLGFGDGHVTFNGLPFDQASDAEQLRVSLAIAMSANPDIRVIRIRDGSLLDKQGLAVVAEMAQQRDYQVWCERVDPSGDAAIIMEDGEIANRKAKGTK